MQIGLSIYSMAAALRTGELSLTDAVREIAAYGADCIELTSAVIPDLEGVAEALQAVLEETGLPVASYSMGENFIGRTPEEYEAALDNVRKHMRIAKQLGARAVRSDLVGWKAGFDALAAECFDADLPLLVETAGRLADYAAAIDLAFTVENHGMYMNGSDRVRRLIKQVNRDNYRCTLDIGNCLCVDEDSVAFTKRLLPLAEVIHFKDFLVRRATHDPTRSKTGRDNWIPTPGGNFLRGTIIGDGDIDTAHIMSMIKTSGYDGAVIIEFEGPESCRQAAKQSLENVKRFAASL